jgi:hypothetical protein
MRVIYTKKECRKYRSALNTIGAHYLPKKYGTMFLNVHHPVFFSCVSLTEKCPGHIIFFWLVNWVNIYWPQLINIKRIITEYSTQLINYLNEKHYTSLMAGSVHCTVHGAVVRFLQYGTWDENPSKTRCTLKCRQVPFCWTTKDP